MPSGRTHDAVTFLLAIPAFAATYAAVETVSSATIVSAAFVFGGLMFGPDLDTISRQYSRWGPLRVLWFPYRSFFPHRSRLSHGIAFGSLLRVIYFMGITTLAVFLVLSAYQTYAGGKLPAVADISAVWSPIGELLRNYLGPRSLLFVFVGLWAGATSHTLTDLAGSFITTGRTGKFF